MQRVVVTGLGAVTPVGNTADEFWSALLQGRSGVGPITKFDATDYPTRIAGEVKNFDPLDFVDKKEARRLDPFLQYAIASAAMAVQDAALDTDRIDGSRFGVLIGSGIGGVTTLLHPPPGLLQEGPHPLAPLFLPRVIVHKGARLVVLESLDHALRRDGRIYAEIVGYGMTGDAHHMTAPDPEGDGAARAMTAALRDGGLDVSAVGYINAHGTSTPYNDRFETLAIKRVFGDHARRLAISSTKSMTGHMLGAAGGVEAIATALALHHGVLPPTINYETPDPDCDLDYVPNLARKHDVEVALSNAFGFGGTNATLAFRTFVR